MTTKLWGGRFSQATLKEVDEFNASIPFDYQLWPYDIEGSIAHVKMLGKQKIIPLKEAKEIEKGLRQIRTSIEKGEFEWKLDQEDVHLNIESELIKRIGPVGGKLHTGRSRNDQVALDLRLYCRHQTKLIVELLTKWQKALIERAKSEFGTLLPGYTHLQRAQPILLSHYFLAYFEMAERDKNRLLDGLKRIEISPLGSGALAGTTFPIDRRYAAELLGFPDVSSNSLDAVGDRDFVVELLSNCTLLLTHLSRMAEEWILWSSSEFSFIQLPQEYCTGSSMMPQKMNPDVLELIRGKTGRVLGNLTGFFATLKALPLAYNKDLQEDKEPLFDTIQTTVRSLSLLTQIVQKTKFKKQKFEQAMIEGFLIATDLADYLTEKGVPFRESHKIVGEIVRYCQEKETYIEKLSLENFQKFSNKIEKDVFEWLTPQASVNRRKIEGGTAPDEVKKQILRAERKVKQTK